MLPRLPKWRASALLCCCCALTLLVDVLWLFLHETGHMTAGRLRADSFAGAAGLERGETYYDGFLLLTATGKESRILKL